MSVENLVCNPLFAGSPLPTSWRFAAPRDEIALGHHVGAAEALSSRRTLCLHGTGDPSAIGWWHGAAELEEGRWYHAEVQAILRDIEHPALSVWADVAGHILLPEDGWSDEVTLKQLFRYSNSEMAPDVLLSLRATERGVVEYHSPVIRETPPPDPRMVRIATVRFTSSAPTVRGRCEPLLLSLKQQRRRLLERIEEAGRVGADVVALPELAHTVGVRPGETHDVTQIAEEVPGGPLCQAIAEIAARRRMHVVAGVMERCGAHIYNAGVVFGREGQHVGTYRKTHLTAGETRRGVSCGTDYPLFDLDCGRVAVHICYDEWFPEVSRYYAMAGAEMLFLLVWGGKPITWRTRALDNRLYLVSSSVNPPSMIIDSSGQILGETHGDGVVYADIDVAHRHTNVYVDPTLSYGMPCTTAELRRVADDGLMERLFPLLVTRRSTTPDTPMDRP